MLFVGRHLEDKLVLLLLFLRDFSLKEGMLNQSKPSFLYLITLEIPARVLVRKSNRFRLLLLSSPSDAFLRFSCLFPVIFDVLLYHFGNQDRLLLSVVLSVCQRTRRGKFAYSNALILVFSLRGLKIRKIESIVKFILQRVVRFHVKKNFWRLQLPRTFQNFGSPRVCL